MAGGLQTPPLEDHSKTNARKNSGKTVKPVPRTSKRSSATHPHPHPHEHGPVVLDGRHKRVWKACERCRMKKTKCDGESPCKRCKDDGLVCTAGTRKKTEYKQLPRGYAEVLENTQYALVATVHKLYAMVRNSQSWELGEPELNERGQPVIHEIASKLGCIRPSSDSDLPINSIFPEDAADFAELQAQLEAQQAQQTQQEQDAHSLVSENLKTDDSSCGRTDRASSVDSEHSELEQEYPTILRTATSQVVASPQTYAPSKDSMDPFSARTSFDVDTQSTMFSPQSPTMNTLYSPWTTSASDEVFGNPNALEMTAQYMQMNQQQGSYMGRNPMGMDIDLSVAEQVMLGQSWGANNFGTIKPNMLSGGDVMIGISDPMVYGGYDEGLRL